MIKIIIEGETVKDVRLQLETYLDQFVSQIASEKTLEEAAKDASAEKPKAKAKPKKAAPKKKDPEPETNEVVDYSELTLDGLKEKCHKTLAMEDGPEIVATAFKSVGANKFGEVEEDNAADVAKAIDEYLANGLPVAV